MRDILEEIIAHKRTEVAAAKEALHIEKMAQMAADAIQKRRCISMSKALAASPSGIIAEFKRRSPSKGWIKESGKAEEIVPAYVRAGATALSILTDSKYFGGCPEFISAVRNLVPDTPIMRKEFIIDEYQLYQARAIDADAVLLIAACLDKEQCRNLAAKAHELGLETLLEIHSESELEYVGENIDMVGVNNRNLGSFVTDVAHSYSLAAKLPKDYVLVSESGISNPETVKDLRKAGFRGFLIGESFMKTDKPGDALASFISKL